MKAFDEQIRAMVQKEHWKASSRAQSRLLDVVERTQNARQRSPSEARWRLPVIAVSLACAASLLLLSFPRPDVQLNGTPTEKETSAVLSQGNRMAIRPEVELRVRVSGDIMRAEATFSNHTEDIWLLEWSARSLNTENEEYQTRPLIWLEPGVTFTDSLEWPFEQQKQAVAEWNCTPYRVTAQILHWMDGAHLQPEEEGYEAQQDLMLEAWKAKALILLPGEWPGGQAGEMQLLLPDTQMQEDALAYYTETGALEKKASEHAVAAADH